MPPKRWIDPTEREKILIAAQKGDQKALEALLTVHRDAVFRYGLRYCKTTEDAEDAVQETLWAAARSIASFRRAAAVTTWLFAIVRNTCHRLWHKQRRRLDIAEMLSLVQDPAESPEEQIAARQTQQMLARALSCLEPPERDVVLLRDVRGLTAPEAAHLLGISVQALKSRLHRARAKLRQEVRRLLSARGSDFLSPAEI
ncbi:MAG TPA: RNA polymerase sigma factor [Bradyrhizobium sp.]|nr:RNA polymerase sigma factor [Bradyrhizobium sp.]